MEAMGTMVLRLALPIPAGSDQPDAARLARAACEVGHEEGRVEAEV